MVEEVEVEVVVIRVTVSPPARDMANRAMEATTKALTAALAPTTREDMAAMVNLRQEDMVHHLLIKVVVVVVAAVVAILTPVSPMALEGTVETSPPTWATTNSHLTLGTTSSSPLLHLLEAMKEALRLQVTTSPQAVDRAEVVMAAVAVILVAMGAAGATSNHRNMEEGTTTSPLTTTPPLHRATVNRASMARVEVMVMKALQ